MTGNQSIHRAFAILQAVAEQPAGARVGMVAARVNLPKSTVSRLLATLEALSAVERLTTSEAFVLGAGLREMVLGAPAPRSLPAVARPVMQALSERTEEAVGLCLLDGRQMWVADLVQTRRRVQVHDVTGQRFPLHATSPGKVLLAALPDRAIRAYLRRSLEAFTSKTITDPKRLWRQLQTVRAQGYAWAHDELEDISGVSAPIHGPEGAVTAAINLYGPTFRFPPAGQAETLTRWVIEAARQISHAWSGPAPVSPAPAPPRKPHAR